MLRGVYSVGTFTELDIAFHRVQFLLEFYFKVFLKRCIEIKLHFHCLREYLHIGRVCSKSFCKVKIYSTEGCIGLPPFFKQIFINLWLLFKKFQPIYSSIYNTVKLNFCKKYLKKECTCFILYVLVYSMVFSFSFIQHIFIVWVLCGRPHTRAGNNAKSQLAKNLHYHGGRQTIKYKKLSGASATRKNERQ